MTVPLHLKVATGGFLRHLPKKSSLSSVPARAASELLQVVRDNTVPCKIIPLLHLPFSCHLNTEIRLPQKWAMVGQKNAFPRKWPEKLAGLPVFYIESMLVYWSKSPEHVRHPKLLRLGHDALLHSAALIKQPDRSLPKHGLRCKCRNTQGSQRLENACRVITIL